MVRSTSLHHRAPSGASAPCGLLALLLAVAAGLAWGGATSGLQTVLRGPWSALANAISPWVLPAFVAGSRARQPFPAVLLGVLVCLGEVGGYYLVSSLRGFGVGTSEIVLWSATALVGGPAFALAGWAWLHAPASRWCWSALGAAMLAGVLLVEGGFHYGWTLGYTSSAVLFGLLGAVAVVGLGAGIPVRDRPREGRVRGVATTIAWLAVVAPAGILGLVVLGTATS